MKTLYKSEIDGKIFESKGKCLKHEFELKNGSELFVNNVQTALKELEQEYDLTFNVLELEASVDWDENPNTDEMNFVEWCTYEIEVYYKGVKRGEDFSGGSSSGIFSKDIIKEMIIKNYVSPYKKRFEGKVEETRSGVYNSTYKIEGTSIEDIIHASFGKTLRIEILD